MKTSLYDIVHFSINQSICARLFIPFHVFVNSLHQNNDNKYTFLLFLFQTLLLEALISNRCDYIKVLLDHGVTITSKDLRTLYEQVNTFVQYMLSSDLLKFSRVLEKSTV